MSSSVAAYELLAELSLALAGFSGVASTFGGRTREFSAIERGRLDAIFLFSGASLAASLLVLALANAGLPDARIYSIASTISGGFALIIFGRQVPKALRLRRVGESTTSSSFIALAVFYFLGLAAIYFWAAVFSRASWPLFSGISSQLLCGLWMFARFLVRSR